MSPWLRGVVLCVCAIAAVLWFRDVVIYLRRGSAPFWGRLWTREADPARFWLIVAGSAAAALLTLAATAIVLTGFLARWFG